MSRSNAIAVFVGLVGLAGTFIGAAVSLFGPAVEIALAAGCIVTAVSVAIWPYSRRIAFRSPVRLLPAYLDDPQTTAADKLDSEFLFVKDAYDNYRQFLGHMKMVLENRDDVKHKELLATPLRPGVERTVEGQLGVARRQLWDAVKDFAEVFDRVLRER